MSEYLTALVSVATLITVLCLCLHANRRDIRRRYRLGEPRRRTTILVSLIGMMGLWGLGAAILAHGLFGAAYIWVPVAVLAVAVGCAGVIHRGRTAAHGIPSPPDGVSEHSERKPDGIGGCRAIEQEGDGTTEKRQRGGPRRNAELILRFPLISIPGSGRQHWLGTLYHEVTRGNVPRHVRCEMHRKRDWEYPPWDLDGSALPSRVELTVRDGDRLGATVAHVVIQDCECDAMATADETMRAASVGPTWTLGQGICVFVDPTRDAPEHGRQLEQILRRLQEMSRVIGARSRSPIPVAICVSKIDLLGRQASREPEVREAVQMYHRTLEEIGWEYDAASMVKRANATQEILRGLNPGYAIDQQIIQICPGPSMLFPITTIGFQDIDEPLPNRVIDPRGILHPIMWLLHMNGMVTLTREE